MTLLAHLLPSLPVALPLLFAALLAGLGDLLPQAWGARLAIAASLLGGAGCWLLARESSVRLLVYWFGGWQPRQGVALGIAFAIDPFGAGLALLAAGLTLAALVFSSRYFDSVRNLFFALLLVFQAAMCGFALTGDIFNLFVFFELMSACAFALCSYKTEAPGPLQGGLNFAITNTLGAFFILSGIGLLYGRTGALNLALIGKHLPAAPRGLALTAFLLIACGFMIKAAIAPFHFWLADAHAVAPTPVCILFSGVMVELGLYAIARVYWTAFAPALAGKVVALRAIFTGFGAATALLGGVMCLLQRHLKRLLAFSTVSHSGLMMIGVGLFQPLALAGTAAYLAGHAMVKSALFIVAGTLLHRFGSVDEFELHGKGRGMRATAAVYFAAAIGLAALPPFALSWGEAAIEAGAGAAKPWLEAVFLLAGVLTAGAALRAGGRIFLGWGARQPRHFHRDIPESRETRGGVSQVSASMFVPALLLLLLGLAFGRMPSLLQAAQLQAGRFVQSAAYRQAVMAARPAPAGPSPHPFAPSPADSLRDVMAALAAIGLAALALRRNKAHAWMDLPIRVLHAVHSGRVGDYTAWMLAGMAILGSLFFALLR